MNKPIVVTRNLKKYFPNPAYYCVEAGRLLAAGHILEAKVGYAFLFLVPLAIITVAWATRAFNQAIA